MGRGMGIDMCRCTVSKDTPEIVDNDRVKHIMDMWHEIFWLEMIPNAFASAKTHEGWDIQVTVEKTCSSHVNVVWVDCFLGLPVGVWLAQWSEVDCLESLMFGPEDVGTWISSENGVQRIFGEESAFAWREKTMWHGFFRSAQWI